MAHYPLRGRINALLKVVDGGWRRGFASVSARLYLRVSGQRFLYSIAMNHSMLSTNPLIHSSLGMRRSSDARRTRPVKICAANGCTFCRPSQPPLVAARAGFNMRKAGSIARRDESAERIAYVFPVIGAWLAGSLCGCWMWMEGGAALLSSDGPRGGTSGWIGRQDFFLGAARLFRWHTPCLYMYRLYLPLCLCWYVLGWAGVVRMGTWFDLRTASMSECYGKFMGEDHCYMGLR
jgi:hypothetical protein